MLIRGTFFILISMILFSVAGCGRENAAALKKEINLCASGKVNSLDPAESVDYVSGQMVSALYDTLLEYDYMKRPYILRPSMLESMPEVNPGMTEFKFTLRDDLYFISDKCFKNNTDADRGRKINSNDVVFSFMRLADGRLHSPGFWIFRGKIKGIDKFRDESASAPANDYSIYDKACEGFEIIDERRFTIKLREPDPRFLYRLAMPFASIVPKEAAILYGQSFSENAVGSGPFILEDWCRDFRIVMRKNPAYRKQLFPEAASPADRTKTLPFADKVTCYLVKQPFASWLMFLQGGLDASTLEKDSMDMVSAGGAGLSPALTSRGIRLIKVPEFQINYVGFSFTDPLLSGNSDLRKAISLAFNTADRIKLLQGKLVPANGAIPPGTPGYEAEFVNEYSRYDVNKASEYLKKAGFPGGGDPKTGKALEFTFDLMGTTPQHRQLAELMVNDMKKIGIKIKPVLNNKPRFLQKSSQGQLQLFRLGWIGDYPDAENFLQLFYGKNAGSCNRSFYRDAKFDSMYEEILKMPDSPERTQKYAVMNRYLTDQCPWIFESFPMSYLLVHSWLENYSPHDFVLSNWKYLSVDPVKREDARKNFKPLSFSELK